MTNLENIKGTGNIDAYESYIPESSLLINKTVNEVMKKYEDKIIIDHLHNSPIEIDTRQPVTSETVFKSGMGVKIFGEWKDICSFTNEYKLP